MKNIYLYDTAIGKLRIVDNGEAIIEIGLEGRGSKPEAGDRLNETPLIKETNKQLSEYFEGKRKIFDFPLNPEGTEFQKKVWKALLDIPYGEVWTYKQIAEKIGCPKGCRAVGNANNKNKILVVIPCHRVIRK